MPSGIWRTTDRSGENMTKMAAENVCCMLWVGYYLLRLALMLQNVGSLCCYDYYLSGAWLIMPWESTCYKWPSLQEAGGQETPNGDSFINDRYSHKTSIIYAVITSSANLEATEGSGILHTLDSLGIFAKIRPKFPVLCSRVQGTSRVRTGGPFILGKDM